ncbi:hypothetical protein QA641_03990 [Bradyrhizobium sp. CB1650]|uniref:hypothetical protein n=1 Tax=Bradyrhizobium sp. CB1650 TaxID=3039153 RepID=UPI0024351BAE|nr:hypothetical protein [Bradyrhizobium sp. CB1650]WGD53108.1 hypothetical protein QA641_03990 [Bradyrhizobium sp. CB1650]
MSTTEPRTNLNRPAHEAGARTDAPSRLGAGSGIIILLLLLLLIAAGFVAYVGWTLADGIEVSTAGYVAMAIGVLFSLLVGCGLMALVFYSSRSGYDEPPVLIEHRPDVPS